MATLFRQTLVILLLVLPLQVPAQEYRFNDVSRIVAMSDPHGAYEAMLATLANAGIVDTEGNWSAADNHLVITGDLLDRGADSRKIMDLVMRLEGEAEAAGGRVHLTLGNHEVMNLVGDLRYVARSEYRAFADEETMEERDEWFRAFAESQRLAAEEIPDEATLREAFDRARPPGFYAHRRAFSSEGQYGRWLLGRPLMVVVNDTAFVHGGLSPLVGELGLDGINDRMGAEIRDYVAALDVVHAAGLIDPAVNFYDHAELAEQLLADTSLPDTERTALETIIRLNDASVHDSESPLWYRGSVGCSLLSESDVIDAALAAVGASRVVIGHTPTVTRRVLTRLDGRVIEIDTGMLNAAYRGIGSALILKGDEAKVVNQADGDAQDVVAHPRRVGSRADSLAAEVIADLMTNGAIGDTGEDAAGRTVVEISDGEQKVHALFFKSPRKEGIEPELAAYTLDKMMGFDLVPVTVPREIDGERGVLQFLPENTSDEAARAASGRGGSAWCPLPRQWNSLYAFDVLIRNESRTPQSMVYNPGNWQIMSMGHEDAFGTRASRPRYLGDAPIQITSGLADALQSLTDERLTTELGSYLSSRQIGAVGKRRDMLLEGVN